MSDPLWITTWLTTPRPTENCYFFSSLNDYVCVIVSHDHAGAYKAMVLTHRGREREVVLSSDSFSVASEAFEQLLTKSADAVHQHISTNGFTVTDGDDDDDGVASVSSYANELDKGGLADSFLSSLGSEAESAYDSASEDGSTYHEDEDGVEYAVSRPRCAVAGCCGPLPGTLCPSKGLAGRRNDGHQARSPAHSVPAHGNRPSPSKAAFPAHAPTGVMFPRLPVPGANTWPQVAPFQPMGPAVPPPVNGITQSLFGRGQVGGGIGNGNGNGKGAVPPQMPHRPGVPARAAPVPWPASRAPGPSPPMTMWAAQNCALHQQQQQQFQQLLQQKQPPQQRPTQQQQPPQQQKQQRPPVPKNVSPSNSAPNAPAKIQTPPQQQGSQQTHLPPLRGGCAPNSRLVVPATSTIFPAAYPVSLPGSDVSSSGTSTPKLTPSSSSAAAPGHGPATGPAAPPARQIAPGQQQQQRIDYRISIRLQGAPPENARRIVARTAPTVTFITQAASRHISADVAGFLRSQVGGAAVDDDPYGPTEWRLQLGTGVPLGAPGFMTVTRAVFTVAPGREESYDLATYGEGNLAGLCESMRASSGDGGSGNGAGAGASAWPLFEVLVRRPYPYRGPKGPSSSED